MFPALDTTMQDLRYAVRTLVGTPAFTVVAILSLALGIGANTTLFSLMDVMLLRQLPVRNPQELVEFVRADPGGSQMTNLPYEVYQSLRTDKAVLSDVFAIGAFQPAVRVNAVVERVSAHAISSSYFPALGVAPLAGRVNGEKNVVLSYAYWTRRFARDPVALGSVVLIAGETYIVSGIMPESFFGLDRGEAPDLWIPMTPAIARTSEVWVMGRLRPGVSLPAAHAALDPLFSQVPSGKSGERLVINRATYGASGVRWNYWEYSNTLKILIGLTSLILLIACANLANLALARSVGRSREIALRLALGATRARLVRQLMTDYLLVSLAGGSLGLFIAFWGHHLMLGFLVYDARYAALDFQLDWRLLAFALALSVVTGLLFGMLPALRATDSIHLKGPARSATRFSNLLVVLQIGLSAVLLIGAGLFTRSLQNLNMSDLGLKRENLVIMDVTPSAGNGHFAHELSQRVGQIPGVQNSALAANAAFGNGFWNLEVAIPGSAVKTRVDFNLVSPAFFETVGIALLAGRDFTAQDREQAPPVALVNQSFARQFFKNSNPIGRHFEESEGRRYEIVGVVADAKYGTVRSEVRPMVYQSIWQKPALKKYVVHLRTRLTPATLEPGIRREIDTLQAGALVSDVRTLPQVIEKQLSEDRMFSTVANFLGLLALVLGAIGIYGLIAYRAGQRQAEMGVRMALGAQKSDVVWLIVRDALVLVSAGAAAGVAGALAAGPLVRSLLYGLSPADPQAVLGALAVLLITASLAALLPAWRAASTDPVQSLRL